MHIFLCENSLDGIMTGIYEAWNFKIQSQGTCQHQDIHLMTIPLSEYALFCEYHQVIPSLDKSQKVCQKLLSTLGTDAYELLLQTALSQEPASTKDMDKGDALYHAIVQALSSPAGARVLNDYSQPCMQRILALSRATQNEAHHLMGFLRFKELTSGILFSTIHPKNDVLLILGAHFSDRFPLENFMIYDEPRKKLLLHRAKMGYWLADASDFNLDLTQQFSEKESDFQNLWLTFFEHIGIEARKNPSLQAQNIPKRFWKDTVELKPLLTK